jgi:hypothetical protein
MTHPILVRIGNFLNKYQDPYEAEYHDFDEFEFLFEYVHPQEPDFTEMRSCEYMWEKLNEYYWIVIDEKINQLFL